MLVYVGQFENDPRWSLDEQRRKIVGLLLLRAGKVDSLALYFEREAAILSNDAMPSSRGP